MPKQCGPEGCVDTDEEINFPSVTDVMKKFEPKKYPHTEYYLEHMFAETFGSGGCGKCPFPRNHDIHIEDFGVIYKLEKKNEGS